MITLKLNIRNLFIIADVLKSDIGGNSFKPLQIIDSVVPATNINLDELISVDITEEQLDYIIQLMGGQKETYFAEVNKEIKQNLIDSLTEMVVSDPSTLELVQRVQGKLFAINTKIDGYKMEAVRRGAEFLNRQL